MILRRIAKSLMERNWGMVLTEILIVVIGIFIGLQVDDWNQARKDRIDERTFLNSLHADVIRADELSRRLRQRRLDKLDWSLSASDVLFNRIERNALTDDECTAIAFATHFSITAPGLPSVDELFGSGRMGIVRDSELRTALVALRQTRAALDTTISEKTTSSNNIALPTLFPEFFRLTVRYDEVLREVQTKNECDLAKMRENQHFLNQFGVNVDSYDAYIRDGVKPWSLQFDRVHKLVDDALSIEH